MKKKGAVFGVGKNDAGYSEVPRKGAGCPYYTRWHNMLRRCYSQVCHSTQPTYKSCEVCNHWLTFSNFKAWMETQNWQGKCLDKDLLLPGNKLYSPATCSFVTVEVNNLLTNSDASRGACLIGVTYIASARKYLANISLKGKRRHLGLFATERQAHNAYVSAKAEHILKIASQQSQPIQAALLRHYELFKVGE